MPARPTGRTRRPSTLPDVGFRLKIPDVGWSHQIQRKDGRLERLVVGPSAAGGYVVLDIRVESVTATGPDAVRTHVETLRTAIADDASISAVEDLSLTIDGHEAKGLRVVQTSSGITFRVNLVFLAARGLRYRIQFHAPDDEFLEHWTAAERVLAGFELTELDAAAQERARLVAVAQRCGSQVDWADDWDDASRRARETGRLVVVAIHSIPGFSIGNAVDEGVFTSQEIVELMKHRFVGWHWHSGLDAPFVDHAVFGLSGSTFGAGLLVCTPDGRVVRQVYVLQPGLVGDALRETLEAHPRLAPAPTAPSGTRVEQVAFLIGSGQLDAADAVLGRAADDEPADLAIQRARLHLVRRDSDGALRTVARVPDDAAGLDERQVVAATAHMGLGDADQASAVVDACLAGDPSPARRADAMLLRGMLAWADGDPDGARATWTDLTKALPDEPSAWIAAAAIVGPALEMGLTPDLSWPPAVQMELARLPEKAPPDEVIEIDTWLHAALDWLVTAADGDDRWHVPAGHGDAHPARHLLAMAAQAICTTALLRAGEDRPAVRDAAERGLRRYLDDHAIVLEHPRPVAFMDYTCWSSSYGLFLVAAALETVEDHALRQRVMAAGEQLVADLVRIQAPNGGWSYYISGEVGGSSPGAAMSFTTATVLLSLHAARDHGLDVPRAALERGHACLSSMRGTNGIFEYMRMGTGAHAAAEVAPQGNAARGPVCTFALQRGGHLDPEAMGPAVDRYVEHLPAFGAEARKALMHAGLATEGSHYLLYDYSTAAEAIRATETAALGPERRDAARKAILAQLDRCRSADGSFVDNPIIGAAPATGLAVMTLLDLAEATR